MIRKTETLDNTPFVDVSQTTTQQVTTPILQPDSQPLNLLHEPGPTQTTPAEQNKIWGFLSNLANLGTLAGNVFTSFKQPEINLQQQQYLLAQQEQRQRQQRALVIGAIGLIAMMLIILATRRK